MSLSLNVYLEDALNTEAVFAILSAAVPWSAVSRHDRRALIQGKIPGGCGSVLIADRQRQQLCLEMYGIRPHVYASFDPDKFLPYEEACVPVLDSIASLIKATHGNAVAAAGETPFLRRVDGTATLFNESGIFSADAGNRWRGKFDLPHDFKPRFER
ncbi:MAG: hypothetical protein EKK53_24405 [Burkholderiales bacterium]|nr:MAG: hypothetical protein EKK53_24405 [Burkholderiales bacterium]